MSAVLNPRRVHIEVASAGFTVLIGMLFLTRLVLAELSFLLIALFVGAMLVSTVTFCLVRFTDRLQAAGLVMLSGLCFALTLGVYYAGGVTQPIAAVGPALPMFATVLLGWKWGWASLCYIFVVYATLYLLEQSGHAFPVNTLTEAGAGVMRLIYIVLTATVVTLIGSLIQTHSDMRADQLTEIAQEDFLTNSLNRRGFDIALRREFLAAKRQDVPLSLLLLDVDHFKQYNDAYGHARGDDCLIAVTDAVNNCLRRPSDIMARIGGDEFAVILPNTEIRGAFAVAEQICERVKGLGLSSPTKPVTVTIGLAEMRGDSQISDYQLVQEADKALYKAKGEGRNQVQMATADNNVLKMAHTS